MISVIFLRVVWRWFCRQHWAVYWFLKILGVLPNGERFDYLGYIEILFEINFWCCVKITHEVNFRYSGSQWKRLFRHVGFSVRHARTYARRRHWRIATWWWTYGKVSAALDYQSNIKLLLYKLKSFESLRYAIFTLWEWRIEERSYQNGNINMHTLIWAEWMLKYKVSWVILIIYWTLNTSILVFVKNMWLGPMTVDAL